MSNSDSSQVPDPPEPPDPADLNQIRGDRIAIEFPDDGVTANIAVTQVGGRLFRLDSVPLLVESASFRDVIEADRLDEATLRFCTVVKASKWNVYDFFLLKERLESAEVQGVLKRVIDSGGYWEQFLGGCLYVCLPPGDAWNPTEAIEGGEA
jgi:hypothetical protein